jgi:hypothetical protein
VAPLQFADHASPLVVVSGSHTGPRDDSRKRGDVEACYRLGANSYHAKPHDFRGYEATIRRLTDYWLSGTLLPVADESPALAAAATETSDPQGWLG